MGITKTMHAFLPLSFFCIFWFQNWRFSAGMNKKKRGGHYSLIRACEVEIDIEWSLRVREIEGQMLLDTFESFPTKSSALFWNVSQPETLLASLALAGNHKIPQLFLIFYFDSIKSLYNTIPSSYESGWKWIVLHISFNCTFDVLLFV